MFELCLISTTVINVVLKTFIWPQGGSKHSWLLYANLKWQHVSYLLYPMPWMKYLKASVSLPGCREGRALITHYTCLHNIDKQLTAEGLKYEQVLCRVEDYNLMTAAHVFHLLMLLNVNFLCQPSHPPDTQHWLSTPVYNVNNIPKPVPLLMWHRRTHLVNLGHASAVSHLENWRENTKRPLAFSMLGFVYLHKWTHIITPLAAPRPIWTCKTTSPCYLRAVNPN